MAKNFVSCTLSNILKNIGFNEPCFRAYDSCQMLYYSSTSNGDILNSNFIGKLPSAAPTYQQTIDWLRENFRLRVVEDAIFINEYFMFSIGKDGKKLSQTKPNSDYYLALEEAIEQALEFI